MWYFVSGMAFITTGASLCRFGPQQDRIARTLSSGMIAIGAVRRRPSRWGVLVLVVDGIAATALRRRHSKIEQNKWRLASRTDD
jgi:hypothetical protein